MPPTIFDLPYPIKSSIVTQVAYRAGYEGRFESDPCKKQETFACWMAHIHPGVPAAELYWSGSCDELDHSIWKWLVSMPGPKWVDHKGNEYDPVVHR